MKLIIHQYHCSWNISKATKYDSGISVVNGWFDITVGGLSGYGMLECLSSRRMVTKI